MVSRSFLSGSALLVPLLFSSQPADAQRVRADIRIHGGPISGHIRIGPDRYRDYRPRVIHVERIRWRDVRRPGWKKWRREARIVVIYLDRRDGRFYDRYRPGLHQNRIFFRGGRYYAWDDDRFDGRDDRYDRYDYNDRDDDRYRRDRRDDRYDDRYDPWENRRDERRDDRDRDRRDDRDRRGERDGRNW